MVEDIVYHYCKRKYDIDRDESVKLFYEIAGKMGKWNLLRTILCIILNLYNLLFVNKNDN